MNKLNNITMILAGVVCLYLAYMTGTGAILDYIHFADPLNEMGFFMCLTSMGGGLVYCGFAKENK